MGTGQRSSPERSHAPVEREVRVDTRRIPARDWNLVVGPPPEAPAQPTHSARNTTAFGATDENGDPIRVRPRGGIMAEAYDRRAALEESGNALIKTGARRGYVAPAEQEGLSIYDDVPLLSRRPRVTRLAVTTALVAPVAERRSRYTAHVHHAEGRPVAGVIYDNDWVHDLISYPRAWTAAAVLVILVTIGTLQPWNMPSAQPVEQPDVVPTAQIIPAVQNVQVIPQGMPDLSPKSQPVAPGVVIPVVNAPASEPQTQPQPQPEDQDVQQEAPVVVAPPIAVDPPAGNTVPEPPANFVPEPPAAAAPESPAVSQPAPQPTAIPAPTAAPAAKPAPPPPNMQVGLDTPPCSPGITSTTPGTSLDQTGTMTDKPAQQCLNP